MIKKSWGFSFLLHGVIILVLVVGISRSSSVREEGVAFQNAQSIQAFALTPVHAQPHSASHPLKTLPKTSSGVYTAASEVHQSQPQEIAGPSHQVIPMAPREIQVILKQVAIQLQNQLVYPQQAELNQETGTVLVQFVLQPSGKIEHSRVVRSSKHADLDQAALQTLKQMKPFELKESIDQPIILQVPMVFEEY